VLAYPDLPGDLRAAVEEHSAGYPDPVTFYVEKLVEGIATLGAAFWPKPVIVRLSDFKSNEYSSLAGGKLYEPHEENPMLGFRGASRYVSSSFRDCFDLECRALKKVRDEMGLTNVEIMVPFVRTVDEARKAIGLLAEKGLKRGENSLRIIMMCEIPSNALLADQFLEHFDGFSIGSNDLTQMTLALDRDSSLVADAFDERDPAGKAPAPSRDTGMPEGRQVRRNLRAGAVGPPRPGAVAGRRGYRESVPQPGHGGRDVALSGERRRSEKMNVGRGPNPWNPQAFSIK
jgi:pyruvate,water dikinase